MHPAFPSPASASPPSTLHPAFGLRFHPSAPSPRALVSLSGSPGPSPPPLPLTRGLESPPPGPARYRDDRSLGPLFASDAVLREAVTLLPPGVREYVVCSRRDGLFSFVSGSDTFYWTELNSVEGGGG